MNFWVWLSLSLSLFLLKPSLRRTCITYHHYRARQLRHEAPLLSLSLSLSALRESCHGSHFPLISKMQFFSFSSFFRDRREKKTRSGDRKTRLVVDETLVVNETHKAWENPKDKFEKKAFFQVFPFGYQGYPNLAKRIYDCQIKRTSLKEYFPSLQRSESKYI